MKKIKLIIVLLGFIFISPLVSAQDTITVELGSKAKILIYAQDREALMRLSELDLNKIIKDVTTELDTTVKVTVNDEVKEYVYDLKFDETTDEAMLERISQPDDSIRIIKKPHNPRSQQFWAIDFGLNNYLNNGSSTGGEPYNLIVGGSRFFGFGAYQRNRIGGKRSPFSVQVGLEFSWYNFMFENSNYIVQTDDGVVFNDYEEDFGESLRKSKLVVPYMNIPLTLNARFRNRAGRRTFNLGVGAYGGIRLGGRSKVKTNGSKDKERGNFFLNNWRYGFEGQAGYRGILFFFRYDMNELFENGKGPDLNAYTFGIRI